MSMPQCYFIRTLPVLFHNYNSFDMNCHLSGPVTFSLEPHYSSFAWFMVGILSVHADSKHCLDRQERLWENKRDWWLIVTWPRRRRSRVREEEEVFLSPLLTKNFECFLFLVCLALSAYAVWRTFKTPWILQAHFYLCCGIWDWWDPCWHSLPC